MYIIILTVGVGLWWLWIFYRHIFVQLALRRSIALTSGVLSGFLASSAFFIASIFPDSVFALSAIVVVAIIWFVQNGVVVVVDASPEYIFQKAEFVLRGMFFRYERRRRSLAVHSPMSFEVLFMFSVGKRFHVLGIYGKKRTKKTILFRACLRKFITAGRG